MKVYCGNRHSLHDDDYYFDYLWMCDFKKGEKRRSLTHSLTSLTPVNNLVNVSGV